MDGHASLTRAVTAMGYRRLGIRSTGMPLLALSAILVTVRQSFTYARVLTLDPRGYQSNETSGLISASPIAWWHAVLLHTTAYVARHRCKCRVGDVGYGNGDGSSLSGLSLQVSVK